MSSREVAEARDDGRNPDVVKGDEDISRHNDNILLHVRYEHLKAGRTYVSRVYSMAMGLTLPQGLQGLN